jgi:hypothetical protein
MQILITPNDIIKRCLWLEYKRFCLKDKNEREINELIQEDTPVILSEEDSYVIGLLKIVETPNIVHRFKEHIEDILKVKSNIFNNKLYISRLVIMKEISTFKNRFPDSYKPPFEYKSGIEEVKIFSDKIYDEVDKLETSSFPSNDKIIICVSSNSVRNLLYPKKEKE